MDYILIYQDSGFSVVHCGIVVFFTVAAWLTYWGFDSRRRFIAVLAFAAFAAYHVVVAVTYHSAVAGCSPDEGYVTEVVAHGRFHSLTIGDRAFYTRPHWHSVDSVGFRDFGRLAVGDHVRYCHGFGKLFTVERSRNRGH